VKPRVICVGDVMIDILATLPTPLAIGSDTPATISLLGGGSAANTASWLVSAGTDATLIARIGVDTFGQLARTELLAAGVECRLAIDEQTPTGSCIVLVDTSGERTMIPDAGANRQLDVADIDRALFVAGSHLHLSAYALFHQGLDAAVHALRLARSAGMTMSVDAASTAPLAELGPERFAEFVGNRLMLLANAEEAQLLSGKTDPEAAAAALGSRFGTAIVKLGADGALWSGSSGLVRVATAPLEGVDTTGAGDAFAAGVLSAALAGAEPAVCLRAGNELAATACRLRGGRPVKRPPMSV
jgi:sugar/nucleoside kinase (ribokinase family)